MSEEPAKSWQPEGKGPYKTKKVRVRASVEYVIEVADWWETKEEVEFFLNDCTRCHDHMIEEIQDLVVREGHEEEDSETRHFCLCPVSKYEYLGDVDTAPEVL